MNEKHRRTGRTTRMLETAIGLAANGENVDIICANTQQASNLKEQVADWLHISSGDSKSAIHKNIVDLELGNRIIFLSKENPSWSWDAWKVIGSDDPVLVDHYAIESAFPKLVQELRRFES